MTAKIKAKWKDIAVRAGKTFLQAFLSAIVIDASSIGNFNVMKPMLISALAAGLSAVMNFALCLLDKEYY